MTRIHGCYLPETKLSICKYLTLNFKQKSLIETLQQLKCYRPNKFCDSLLYAAGTKSTIISINWSAKDTCLGELWNEAGITKIILSKISTYSSLNGIEDIRTLNVDRHDWPKQPDIVLFCSFDKETRAKIHFEKNQHESNHYENQLSLSLSQACVPDIFATNEPLPDIRSNRLFQDFKELWMLSLEN